MEKVSGEESAAPQASSQANELEVDGLGRFYDKLQLQSFQSMALKPKGILRNKNSTFNSNSSYYRYGRDRGYDPGYPKKTYKGRR